MMYIEGTTKQRAGGSGTTTVKEIGEENERYTSCGATDGKCLSLNKLISL